MNPFEQQVRERAYYIWEGEGRIFGRADEHWLTAEGELRALRVAAPVLVQPVAADLSLAPSPAKTLKTKPAGAKTAVTKTAVTKTAAAKAEPAKVVATKTAATKASSTKASSTKTSAAKPAAKTAKPAAAKPRASRAAVESGATLH